MSAGTIDYVSDDSLEANDSLEEDEVITDTGTAMNEPHNKDQRISANNNGVYANGLSDNQDTRSTGSSSTISAGDGTSEGDRRGSTEGGTVRKSTQGRNECGAGGYTGIAGSYVGGADVVHIDIGGMHVAQDSAQMDRGGGESTLNNGSQTGYAYMYVRTDDLPMEGSVGESDELRHREMLFRRVSTRGDGHKHGSRTTPHKGHQSAASSDKPVQTKREHRSAADSGLRNRQRRLEATKDSATDDTEQESPGSHGNVTSHRNNSPATSNHNHTEGRGHSNIPKIDTTDVVLRKRPPRPSYSLQRHSMYDFGAQEPAVYENPGEVHFNSMNGGYCPHGLGSGSMCSLENIEEDEGKHGSGHKAVGCALCKRQQGRSLTSPENGLKGSQSDVSSIASSTRSSRWAKDPTEDASPITNPVLKSKLQGAQGVKVTGRDSDRRRSMPLVRQSDQKILELMLKKREAERQTKEASESIRVESELQRQQDSLTKQRIAAEKRRGLIEERRRKELERVKAESMAKPLGVRKAYSASDTRLNHYQRDPVHGSLSNLEAGLQRKRGDSRSSSRAENLDQAHVYDKDLAVQRKMDEKQREMEDKRRRSVERRKIVERRLDEQRKMQEEETKVLEDKQRRSVRRVASLKEERDKETLQKTRLKNLLTQKRHTERLKQLQQQEEEDRYMLQAAIEEKERISEQKVEEVQKQKEREMKRHQYSLESRLERAKQLQKQREAELEEWKNDLLAYRKLQEQKADEIAKMSADEKKNRAAEERRLHERLVRHNMEKLNEQEEEWKADVEATIAMKDARSRILQMEKEEMIQKSRELALASQKLREELRSHYSMNDIDQLSRQAELQEKILIKSSHPS